LFDAAQRRLKHVQALREIDIAITGSVDLRVSLKTILEQVLSQMNVDAACVLLLNPYTQTLEYAAGRGFRTNALQHTRLRLGEGYAGQAALGRRTVHVAELNKRKTDFLRSPFFSSEGFITYFAVPLIAKSQVRGVLEIFHRSQLNPDHEWLDFLDALAGQAAIAIDNTSLFDDLQRSNQELILAYDATIEGWSRALDLRDKETEGHTQRVNDLTVQIARSMRYSEGELIHVRRGALLHDIGKMGIPDNILLKPGPLTPDERTEIQRHSEIGHRIAQVIPELLPIAELILRHHEWWNGQGYPLKLSGEDIPVEDRILSIVDAFDAMTNYRPYRDPMLVKDAIRELKSNSGTHFDPEIVKAFVKMLEN
jgi:putative nucleotidyltransferase with HDIG domain